MIAALVAVIEMKNKDNSVNIAIGLLNRLKSPEFIISMLVAEEILNITNSLSEQLQGIQLTIGNACSLILSTHEVLKNLKEGSSFEIICKKAHTFATDLGIDLESSSIHTSTESTPVVKSKHREIKG